MQLTLLGTGNAGGVPLYGCACRACRRAAIQREYRRRSACALLETGRGRWLLDAGLEDLGDRFPSGQLDAIVLTHYHMDHVQGLFRMRWGTGPALPVLGPDDPVGCDDLFKHPGLLDFSRVTRPFEPLALGDLVLTPLPLAHSRPTLGYLVEHGGRRLAYLSDTSGLPDATRERLRAERPEVMVLDCSFAPRESPPRNHNDLTRALQIHAEIAPDALWLTHVGHAFDDWLIDHAGVLPDGVRVARDGAVLTLEP